MKKVWLCGMGFLLMGATAIEAKYVAPDNVKSRGTKVSGYMMKNQDGDGDGKLTLEEFKNHTMTKDMKQNIRQQKKKGVYKTPEEQFKIMDEDGDGKITAEDLAKFLDKQREEMNK